MHTLSNDTDSGSEHRGGMSESRSGSAEVPGPAVGHDLLTIRQVTALLDVTRRTVQTWLSTGRVAYVRDAAGGVLVLRPTLFRDGNVKASELDLRLDLAESKACLLRSDERLRAAGDRVGILMGPMTADWMAEEIISLRSDRQYLLDKLHALVVPEASASSVVATPQGKD